VHARAGERVVLAKRLLQRRRDFDQEAPMPGIALLVIVLIVLVFGGLIFARISRVLNERRRAQPGDKDLLADDGGSGERPVHRHVSNENQPRFQ
jgi:hypothetical protein